MKPTWTCLNKEKNLCLRIYKNHVYIQYRYARKWSETGFVSRFAETGKESTNHKLCFISFVWVTVQLVVPQFGKTTIAYAILWKNLMTICVSKCITIMFVQCTVFRMAKYFEALFWALLPAFTVCLLFRMSFKFIYTYIYY